MTEQNKTKEIASPDYTTASRTVAEDKGAYYKRLNERCEEALEKDVPIQLIKVLVKQFQNIQMEATK